MKTKLFYFTGTGNSLAIARDIAKELGDCEVISMAKAIKQSDPVKADCVGFVFPVYMWGMPLIAAEFVSRLRVSPSTYIFGVMNYGGFPGGTLLQLKKILKTRGLELAAGFGILMPGNYTPMYGAKPREAQEKCFAQEREDVKKIAADVKAQVRGKVRKDNFLVNAFFSGVLYKGGSKQIHKSDSKYWVNAKCNSCGTCAKVCPVGNIELSEGKPKWLGKCEQCMSCLQFCPQEAIEFGKKTPGRTRYRHPDLKAADLIREKQ